ncbi:hypothetical protein PoB_007456500 [Plakobranchus ocellatus]|uniref:Uncharacterized protein n=1 Tax=Plakobranchus ocellatus TaxID=259542 RepID=A0AAV4DVH4_9GAST|nr:hypothetical protein PoB_007456500 [Plakobranchus ocellatus]
MREPFYRGFEPRHRHPGLTEGLKAFRLSTYISSGPHITPKPLKTPRVNFWTIPVVSGFFPTTTTTTPHHPHRHHHYHHTATAHITITTITTTVTIIISLHHNNQYHTNTTITNIITITTSNVITELTPIRKPLTPVNTNTILTTSTIPPLSLLYSAKQTGGNFTIFFSQETNYSDTKSVPVLKSADRSTAKLGRL